MMAYSTSILRRISRYATANLPNSNKPCSRLLLCGYNNHIIGGSGGAPQRRSMSSTIFSSSSSGNKSISYSSSSPWLMLPPAYELNNYMNMIFSFYSLVDHRVRYFGGYEVVSSDDAYMNNIELVSSSGHGWISLFNIQTLDLFLFNPLNNARIKLPRIPYRAVPSVKTYPGCVRKVITSCSPYDPQHDCRVVMSYGPYQRLAVCSPNGNEWTHIGNQHYEDNNNCSVPRGYADFVYSSRQKLFYCIDKFMGFEAWDLQDTKKPMMIHQMDPSPSRDDDDEDDDKDNTRSSKVPGTKLKKSMCKILTFLVVAEKESGDVVYQVRRYVIPHMALDGSYYDNEQLPYKTIGFDVYKYDLEKNKLVYMDNGSLDGLAFFIGNNHSFALPAAGGEEFPVLKANSIYYGDVPEMIPPKWVTLPFGGHDIGIFNYQDKSFSPCYYPCDIKKVHRLRPPPTWFTPTTN